MRKEKVLVTGLCFFGNIGGQSLALSLKSALEKERDYEFLFSVPDDQDYDLNEKVAERFGIRVLRKIGLKNFIPPWCFKKMTSTKIWFDSFREVDYIIDLNALTYVSPPNGRILSELNNRFLIFLISLLFRKKLIGWTQTYGPLTNRFIRLMAKFDLSRQEIIFCRGENSRNEVDKLKLDRLTLSFPDIACLLPYKEINTTNLSLPEKFISYSPSTIIYSKFINDDKSEAFYNFQFELLNFVNQLGYTLMLIPHVKRDKNATINNCDYLLCEKIYEKIKSSGQVSMFKEELSASLAKSLISKSQIHIGARYHTLVASLSSSTPCISLSWHHKYLDLFSFYKMKSFVIDYSNENLFESLKFKITEIHNNLEKYVNFLKKNHEEVIKLLAENISLFEDLNKDL